MTLIAEHVFLDGRWQRDARFASDAPARAAWALPGVPNLHSHAFQRAMAGLAERQTNPQDSFWTWREVMYGFAAKLTPEALRDIAAMLYVEMLEAGYTSVCEFHYLHHAPDGKPYADPAQMSLALVEAARETGIALTLLPTLYMTGGFDGRPLNERQRRFGHDVDGYLKLVERLRSEANVGLCFHSLRAVPEDAMRAVLDAQRGVEQPIHLHIAEQIGEVQDSLAIRNARPVEWLLDRMPVDANWTLVHATHLTPEETRALAKSGAVVAICPTTEANLGDGLFPLREYLDAGGAWGIGSDSHISVSPVEELRWLEYGQRLHARRRNIAVTAAHASTGETLLRGAVASGKRSTGRDTSNDRLVLEESAPQLVGATPEDLIDRFIFSGNRNLIREVYVDGRPVVTAGRHPKRETIEARYRDPIRRLLA